MNKRVNYMQLLKESVSLDPKTSDHDTGKSVDVKGPFLDPILGYDGGGELPTHKDAASILERYYFKNNADPGVRVNQEEAEIRQVGGDKGALPDEPEDVESSKDDIEDAVMMEESDDVENAVIERLIAEMEELSEIGGPEPDQDPAAKFHEPSGEMEDDPEDLITGDAHDKMPPAAEIKEDLELFDLLEADDMESDDDDDEDEDDVVAGGKETPDDEKLDVDKEIKENSPIGNPQTADMEDLEEAFQIFNEDMENDDTDVPDLDENDVIV